MRFCQNKYTYFFVFICLFLSIFQSLFADTITERLVQLSSEERKSLEHFFVTIMKNDHLGHVLFFSNKPACLTGTFFSDKANAKLFIEGWEVWKKKEYLFPHPNFIILDEIIDRGDSKILHLYFINKKTLTHHLSKNENILKEIFGKDFDPDEFVKNLDNKKIDSLSNRGDTLIGFLLGYGIKASSAYANRKNVQQNENFKIILCAQAGKVNIQQTEEALTCTLSGKVLPVSFFGDPNSEEVKILREEYSNELEKIEKIFDQKNLLEISLQALCQDN